MLKTSFSKTRRPFGQPVAEAKGNPGFIGIPKAPPQNLTLPLETIIPGITEQLDKANKLVFHTVGDTGPVHHDNVIKLVADKMESQFVNAPKVGNEASLDPSTTTSPMPEAGDPSFFYHLGDVVYFSGISTDYPHQFYEPYQYYPARIFAIPGNHDGDNRPQKGDPPDSEPSLDGFFENFCDSQPRPGSAYRPTMTQPYVYWTLDAPPFATIIGLYSNVDGSLDPVGVFQQQAWLQQQLKSADQGKCLILAVHHPCFSLDEVHGGNPDILASLQDAAKEARRWPDVVLTGHVHNFQRFTQTLDDGTQIPHLIIGDGGYADSVAVMHKLQRDPEHDNSPITTPFDTDMQGVTLEAYNEVDGGFGRITVDATNLTFEYFACPLEADPEQNGQKSSGPAAEPFDTFTLNWKTKKIVAQGSSSKADVDAKVATHPKRNGAGTLKQGWPRTGPSRDRTSRRG